MNLLRPRPRREQLRLELIEPDARLQQRKCEGELTYDPAHVEALAELYESGVTFEPLEVVEEQRPGKQPLYHLFDGFHRFEVYRRAESPSAECLVYPGTFRDAELWSLSVNSKQVKPRTPEECFAAFSKLVGSPSMLEAVRADAPKLGGLERALAVAAGLSHGAVGKYLRRAGLRADRITGRLVPVGVPTAVDQRREAVAAATAAGRSVGEIAEEAGTCPQVVRKYQERLRAGAEASATSAGEQDESGPVAIVGCDPVTAAALDEIAAVEEELRSVARRVDSLLGSQVGQRLRLAAEGAGVPFKVERRAVGPGPTPRPGDSPTEQSATWPAFATLCAVFTALQTDLAAVAVQDQFQVAGIGD